VLGALLSIQVALAQSSDKFFVKFRRKNILLNHKFKLLCLFTLKRSQHVVCLLHTTFSQLLSHGARALIHLWKAHYLVDARSTPSLHDLLEYRLLKFFIYLDWSSLKNVRVYLIWLNCFRKLQFLVSLLTLQISRGSLRSDFIFRLDSC